jgi:hypothetical protein
MRRDTRGEEKQGGAISPLLKAFSQKRKSSSIAVAGKRFGFGPT